MMFDRLLSPVGKPSDHYQKFPNRWVMVLVMATGFIFLGATSPNSPSLDLGGYRGQVVYIDFWASWCGPCKQSFPWLVKMQSTYGPKGFKVIAVNVDRDRAKADAFLAQNGKDLQVIYDPKGALAAKYKIKGMPSSILVGRDGHIRYSHTGFYESEMSGYEAQISELINEK